MTPPRPGRAAHFDCFSGISGDMVLGALIDLGVPVGRLKDDLSKVLSQKFDIQVKKVLKNGVAAQNVRVIHDPADASPTDFVRVTEMIGKSGLPEETVRLSLDIFKILAEAEGRVHGCPADQVHFHEVGAADAIVDIVGAAIGVSILGLGPVSASRIPLGRGQIGCAHGTLPVPAPAVVEILKGVPVCRGHARAEMTTPTGAAIIVALADSFGSMPDMTLCETGMGAGDADFPGLPNVLRVMIGDPDLPGDWVDVIETSIDDMSPEFYGLLMERLFEDGALDVCMIPVFMKKNRPGTLVKVLCRPRDRDAAVRRILSETTSAGVRWRREERAVLPRETVFLDTTLGKIQCKRIVSPDGEARLTPEHESCGKIAREKNIPLRKVYEAALLEGKGKI
ncbi:putative nickel insertion protein [Candidatus Desulfarcum epimagneticum]|uniref:Putative nickel insertion protein n=1 Tax=uncultured Desulfobacteraceae bacterium TaxID=218296 RepID=A0A484HJQ4_9BACT|nr:putative nickel insertion protein [uncultured Desulfobacteraceae bacterium]